MKKHSRLHGILDLLALALTAGGLALWWFFRAMSRIGELIGPGFAEQLPM